LKKELKSKKIIIKKPSSSNEVHHSKRMEEDIKGDKKE
jgi:hypothetical protein